MSAVALYRRFIASFDLTAIARRATPESLRSASAQAAGKYGACPKITSAQSAQNVKHRNPVYDVIEVSKRQ